MTNARVWSDTQTACAGARELGRLQIVAAGHGGGEEGPPATEEGKKRLALVAVPRARRPCLVVPPPRCSDANAGC
jgi:hypothetical protein